MREHCFYLLIFEQVFVLMDHAAVKPEAGAQQ